MLRSSILAAALAAAVAAATPAAAGQGLRVSCSLADADAAPEVLSFRIDAADAHALTDDVRMGAGQRMSRKSVAQFMVTPATLHLVVANRDGEAMLTLSASAVSAVAETAGPSGRGKGTAETSSLLGTVYSGRVDRESGDEAVFDATSVTCTVLAAK